MIVLVNERRYKISKVNFGEVKVKKVSQVSGRWVTYGTEISVNPSIVEKA